MTHPSRPRRQAIVMFFMLAMLGACHRTPDEVQVREAIAAVAAAAEAGSASGVTEALADDFDGNAGELDRAALGRMIRVLSLRDEHVGVTVGPIAIEHRGARMVATFTATLRSGGRLLPDQLGVYKVETAWRQDGGHWRCYHASWTRPL